MDNIYLDLLIKIEKVFGIVVGYIRDNFSQQFFIRRQLSIYHIIADQIAQDPSKIFMSRERQKASGIGQHPYKTA
jgi:hypothetical protein